MSPTPKRREVGWQTRGLKALDGSFGQEAPRRRTRVLIVTGDALGELMAGPAIRAWRISDRLSETNDVRLVSWNAADRLSDRFEVHHVPLADNRSMSEHEKWADVVLIQGSARYVFRSLAATKKVLIADLYDPMHLEQLEQGREFGVRRWQNQIMAAVGVLNDQVSRADFFLCASEAQRSFWLGHLASAGRINSFTYEQDSSLDDLIAVVPFGLDNEPPRQTRHAIRGTIPGIGQWDKVLVWGGGIYNWFDPLTLIRAMRLVADRHPDVKLLFLGVTHANPNLPEMGVVGRAIDLADELGLTGKNVFFNQEWVPFDDRHNYLMDADAGVSTHYEHVETRFSFRTRIIDYIWAGLPVIATRGDSFADVIDSAPVGITVPERDPEALASAIVRVLYDDELRAVIDRHLTRVREDYTWERALEPLVAFCELPRKAADRTRVALGKGSGKLMGFGPMAMVRIAAMPPGVRRNALLLIYYVHTEGLRATLARLSRRLGY